jgi:hypothetical protein
MVKGYSVHDQSRHARLSGKPEKQKPATRSDPRIVSTKLPPRNLSSTVGQEEILTVVPVAEQPTVRADRKPESATTIALSSVDLGPDLPMAVFTSTEVWNPERIGALAIYCSDGRWGEAFDDFCHKRLLIPRYDRLAIPGGPAWLASSDPSAKAQRDSAHEQLTLVVRVHEIERIVLISHYGCAFYVEKLGKDADGCLPVQMSDLRAGAETLRGWFPTVRVETYLAMRRGNCLSFHG